MPRRRLRTICSAFFPRRALALCLSSSTLREMIATAEAALPNECGGILLGHREKYDVHICCAIPVPDQAPSHGGYVRSHDAAQKLLDGALADGSVPSLGWVGEWHSHPNPSEPSPRDLCELSRLAREDGRAVGLIVLVRNGPEWKPVALVAKGHRPRVARVDFD